MIYIKSRFPDKRGTHARRLAYRLRNNGVRCKVVGNHAPTADRRVYNMGCAGAVDDPCVDILNSVDSVRLSVDKRSFIRALDAADIPCVLSNESSSLNPPSKGRPWFIRTLTRGKSGDGIVLVEDMKNFDKDMEKFLITQPRHVITDQRVSKELRFHQFKGSTFHLQQKRRMDRERAEQEFDGIPENIVRNCIRTYSNGWVFANEIERDIPQTLLDEAERLATSTMRLAGIDLGCVDISLNLKSGSLMVIETGTSPSLSGTTTMHKYIEVLKEWDAE